MNRVFLQFLLLAPLAVLAGCSSQGTQSLPDRSPEQVRARVVQLLPASIADRQGWAIDIQAAFAAQGLAPSDENLCSVLAVAEQERYFATAHLEHGAATGTAGGRMAEAKMPFSNSLAENCVAVSARPTTNGIIGVGDSSTVKPPSRSAARSKSLLRRKSATRDGSFLNTLSAANAADTVAGEKAVEKINERAVLTR